MIRSEGADPSGGRFASYFVQMVIAMMLGMLPLFVLLCLLGINDLSTRRPELFASLMALAMVLPMATWMHFRMSRRGARTTEMSVARSAIAGGRS